MQQSPADNQTPPAWKGRGAAATPPGESSSLDWLVIA